MHFASSTYPMLEQLNMSSKIVPSAYQPGTEQGYYFAIGPSSRLRERIPQIEGIIRKAVIDGEFQRIRSDHYLELNSKIN